MKKRILAVLMAAAMTAGLTACGGGGGNTETSAQAPVADGGSDQSSSGSSDGGFELALVTDLGTIDDKSFNQGAWEGMTKYAEENGISYKYYHPFCKVNFKALFIIRGKN